MLEFDHVEGTGLVKMFGTTRALGPVDVRFEQGTVTVIDGPNGSGKSTLIGLLALLLKPTRGTLRFGSYDAAAELPLRRRLGVVAHAPMLYPDLNAEENLSFFARLYGVEIPHECVARASERFELKSWSERPVRTYSRGQLQRVALARALLHTPRFILLDEPSTGLDVASMARLEDVIAQEKRRGAIQVLVTHDERLAARVADRRIRIEHGRVTNETAEVA